MSNKNISPNPDLRSRYGSWAIVTGASDGIGRAFAIELAKRGLNIILVARRREMLEQVASHIHEHCKTAALVLQADLSETGSPRLICDETAGLDVGIFVASAGFGTSGDFLTSSIESDLEMIDVNCRSLLHMTHTMGKRFSERGRGAIILMSSLVAFQGVPRAASYAATKAFVQTFAEGVFGEFRKKGIDLLAVAPGPVNSGFATRANMNMGMAQTPDEIAIGSLAALGKRRTVRPGFLAKLLEFSLAPLPRWGRTKVMQLVMKGMTKHQVSQANSLR